MVRSPRSADEAESEVSPTERYETGLKFSKFSLWNPERITGNAPTELPTNAPGVRGAADEFFWT
jgi:hypothetical protein